MIHTGRVTKATQAAALSAFVQRNPPKLRMTRGICKACLRMAVDPFAFGRGRA